MAITSSTVLIKSPEESYLVNMSFSGVVNTGAVITGYTLNYTPLDNILVLTRSGIVNPNIYFIISSGTNNTNYRINVDVYTNDNETLTGAGILKVRSI